MKTRILKLVVTISVAFMLTMSFAYAGIEIYTNDKEETTFIYTEEKVDLFEKFGIEDKLRDTETYEFVTYDDLGVRFYEEIPLDKELQMYTQLLCIKYGVEFSSVLAVIDVESNFNVKSKSKTGDYGLMQININNHKWLSTELGISDFMDAKQNILAGIYILSDLHSKYDGHRVYMSYNMGSSGATKMIENGKYKTEYSIKVMKNIDKYEDIIKRGNNE